MIVRDTHVLIWWVTENPRLSHQAGRALQKELADDGGQIFASAVMA